MRVRTGRVSELLSPDEEVILIEVGEEKVVRRMDYARLVRRLAELSEEEAMDLGLRVKRWARRRP